MTRRDGITIAAITVFALGAALVLQGVFTAARETSPSEAPQLPRTAVLPDPPRVDAGPAMLRVRVSDAETGVRIEDGVMLRFSYAEGAAPVAIARGGKAGSDIVLAKAPGGTLVLTATRPYYLSPAPVSVGLEQGKTGQLSITMERLHAVTIRAALPDGSTPALVGLARVAPLPQWPAERPLVQWAERIGEGFSLELPAGQYACCVPLRDYSRDTAGRAWISAAQLNAAPGFVIPGPCLFADVAVTGAAALKLPLPAPTAAGAIKGRIRTSAGAPAAWEVVELIRIGPGPFRCMQAEVLSDDSGRFEASGLAAGACEIRVRDVEGALKHVEVGAAPLEVEFNLPPAPEAAGNAPGTVRMVVLRNGQPIAGAGMLLLGAGDANTWKSAPPGLRVGNQTGHPGVVEWHGVEAGKQYELTAWPYTARTVKVSVHGGATVRVLLDIAPAGTGALRMTVPTGDERWYEVMTGQGDRLAVANPDLDAVVHVQGLPAGEVVITVFNDRTDKRRATATVEAGKTTDLKWALRAATEGEETAPPKEAVPPESPKETPREPPKEAPGETPKEVDPEAPKDRPGDSAAWQAQQADPHDRPIGHVKIRLPAPAAPHGHEGFMPRDEFLSLPVTGLAPMPAAPVEAPHLAGRRASITLDVPPDDPALWQSRLTLRHGAGEVTVALFQRCLFLAADGSLVEVRAGLCSRDGKAALVVRGALDSLHAVTVSVPGFADAGFKTTTDWQDQALKLARR